MSVEKQLVEVTTPTSPRWYAYCPERGCGVVGRLRSSEFDARLDDYEHAAVCSSRVEVAA